MPWKKDGHLRNFEATLRRKNGSPIYVLINAFGMYDRMGRLLQIRGLMLDVTGLHTYQSELQRERDFSGKILSNTQSLILVADTAGLISYANRRWYEAGFEQRELLGRPLLELAAPGYVRPLADALQAILRGAQVDNLELQIMRGNGHARPILGQPQPHARRAGQHHQHRRGHDRHYRLCGTPRQTGACRKNGGRRTIGFRRRP